MIRALCSSRVEIGYCDTVACFNVSISWLCMGMDEANALVRSLCFSRGASGVVSLQHVSMFQYAGCAWAWTRQAPWYMPCARDAWFCVVMSLAAMCVCFTMLCERLNMLVLHSQRSTPWTCLVKALVLWPQLCMRSDGLFCPRDSLLSRQQEDSAI